MFLSSNNSITEYDFKLQGALVGGISGLGIMSWWCMTAQLAIARGELVHPHKPLTTEGCSYNFTIEDNVIGHFEHR